MPKSLLIFSFFLSSLSVAAQCPARDSLWDRITSLTQRSYSFSRPEEFKEPLEELLNYETRINNCYYRYDSTHAFLLQRIGAMYSKTGEYFKAIHYTRLSVNMVTNNVDKPATNASYLVKNYYNLSSYYGALNMVKEKMVAIDSCINVATRLGFQDYYYLFALTEKVKHLFDIGDYGRCYQYAVFGETATTKYATRADSINYLMAFLTLKVNSLLVFKNYDEAEKLLSRKLQECISLPARAHIGTLYELLAEVQLLRKNPGKAIYYFEQAFNSNRSTGFNLGCMQTLNNLGYNLYFKYYGDVNKALSTYKRALQFSDKNEVYSKLQALESLNILSNIAGIYSHRGRFDSASHYFQLAFNQLGPGMNETRLAENLESFIIHKKTGYLIEMVIDKADAFLEDFKRSGAPDRISEALRIYKVADRLLDRLKSEQGEIQSKLFWRNNSRRLYEHAIEACFLGKQNEDAFYFFEKSRSVLLNDQLNEQRWLGEDDILMQAQLKKKILNLERELMDSGSSGPRKNEIQNELFLNKQAFDHFLTNIKNRNPLYYQSFLDTTFIKVRDVQDNILRDRRSLVELFTGDSAVYCIIITKKDIHLSRINKSEFDRYSTSFRTYVSDVASLNRNFDSFINTSRSLYQLIFHDYALEPGRTIISPDGHHFPFEALVRSKPGEDLSYLIENNAVTYTYSARFLMNRFLSDSGSASGMFMGIAPVQYHSKLPLAALPGSDHSLKKLRSYFDNAEIFVFASASKANFLNHFYRYKIIQLYTHASDSGNTGEPVIYFADSTLYLSDLIPASNPVTSLILLSACETGAGRLYKGEGIFNFNRGFAALGIPASISNLWTIDDKSTYRLTELFYKYLKEGIPMDVAFQKSKIEFLKTSSKEKQLPYFWAASVLVGKTNDTAFKTTFSWKIIGIIAGIALLTLFWFGMRYIGMRREV